jgi:hypothetical protein
VPAAAAEPTPASYLETDRVVSPVGWPPSPGEIQMWTLLKVLAVKWVLGRLLLKGAGSLFLFLPIAALLKAVGWPLLMVLGVLALPVLLVLLFLGLPIFLVLLLGAGLLALLGSILAAGGALLKVLLFVGVPVALAWWLWTRLRPTTPGTP